MKKKSIVTDWIFLVIEVILICIALVFSGPFFALLTAAVAAIFKLYEFLKENNLIKLYKININPLYEFIIFSIFGTIPILVHYANGGFNRPHHIIGNTAALPLLIVIVIEELKKQNRQYKIFKYVNENFSKLILNTTSLLFQLSIFYVFAFEKMYIHRDRSISGEINELYLIVSFFIITVWLSYFLLFLLTQPKKDEFKLRDLYPYRPFICIGYFMLVWSYLCYYEADHKMEFVYYVSIGLYIAAAWAMYILCILKSFYEKKDLFIISLFNTLLTIVALFYALIVLILQDINKFHQFDNNYFFMFVGLGIILLLLLIVVAFVPNSLKDKDID
jgi:hypothetical protein